MSEESSELKNSSLDTPGSSLPQKSGYALFDLDHTLLPFDTQALFCNFVLKREGWRRLYLLWFLPCAPLAALRLLSLRSLKRLYSSYLWRMPEERLRRYAEEFAETVVEPVLYPEVKAELDRHRAEGRLVVLNSASPGFYVEEIARVLKVDRWFATRMRVTDPMPFLPEIDGPNNKHEAKLDAMAEVFPKTFDREAGEKLADSWGYSDSAADVAMLSLCEEAVMIHPGSTFAEIGTGRNWKTLRPARPYCGKWGSRFASLFQAFGLYRLPSPPSPDGKD